jgi:hypothetical protein
MRKTTTFVLAAMVVLAFFAEGCDRPPVPAQLAPRPPLLSFSQEGGIAGFMDRLAVGEGGVCYARRGGQNEWIGTLSNEEWVQLESWLQLFSPFTLTAEDNPGGPDNLVRRLLWAGQGTERATEAQQRQILDWALRVLGEISAVEG